MYKLTEEDLMVLHSWANGSDEYRDEEIKSRFQFIFAAQAKADELFHNYEARLKALETSRYLAATSLRLQEFEHRWKESYPPPSDDDRRALVRMAESINSFAPDSAEQRIRLMYALLTRYAVYEKIERDILGEANIPFNRPQWAVLRDSAGGITARGCNSGATCLDAVTPFLFRTEIAALAFATYYGYFYTSVLGI